MKELQLPRQVQTKWKAGLIKLVSNKTKGGLLYPEESVVVLGQGEEGTTEAKGPGMEGGAGQQRS